MDVERDGLATESLSKGPTLAFGPVPSRRLGRSLGVNVVPFKVCTYSCVYCQLGPTLKLTTRRKRFYEPRTVAREVSKVIERARGEIDAVTVIGEGEPTLASNLGEIVENLREIWSGRIALISNGSLFFRGSVRTDSSKFDVVSTNVSAGDERTYTILHRPAEGLAYDKKIEGLKRFRSSFGGEFWTETMLVRGVNDGLDQLRAIREEILSINPDRAFLTVPTRPPASKWVRRPTLKSFQVALKILDFAEDMHEPEGEFVPTEGEASQRLLRISEMHPLREEQAIEILRDEGSTVRAHAELESLVRRGELVMRAYRGIRFYSRTPGRKIE